MFAKTTLASAVAAALGVSAVALNTAQADTIFFPTVVLSDTVTTIVSVINTTAYPLYTTERLHYRLYYKPDDLTSPCAEYNVRRATSRNDIQTIDLGGKFGQETLGVLFEDPSTSSLNNDWDRANATYSIGKTFKPARGYLIVDNLDTAAPVSPDENNSLTGEAYIFEFGSGAAWGYEAYSNSFYDIFDPLDYRWATSESPKNVAILPLEEFATAFFVTPVDRNQAPINVNNYKAKIWLGSDGTLLGQAPGYTNVIFDRDENPVSGTVAVEVTCTGRVNVDSLLGGGAKADLIGGGWGQLQNYRSENSAAETSRVGAAVIKLEYNAGSDFNGEDVSGTFNNAILIAPNHNLRNTDTYPK